MKTFCKIAAFLLAALMLVSLVACTTTPAKTNEKPNVSNPTQGGETTNSGETSASEQPQPTDGKPDFGGARFDGETVKFFVNGGEGGLAVRSIVLTEKDDPDYEVNRAVVERNNKVKDELGVEIELAGTCGMQEAHTVLSPILLSHIYTYDVLALYQYFDLGLALNDTVGSFFNYLRMPEGSYLNLDAPYWNQRLFNTLAYKGAAFFLTGDLNQATTGTMFVSYVNAKIWDQYKNTIKTLNNNPEGIDNIYDMVKKGYWTMDLWMELSKMAYQDTNNNELKDVGDIAGLMTYDSQLNNIMTDMFAAGAGVTYSSFDTEGKPIITFNSQKNLDFADKLYQLLCESNAVTIPWLKAQEGEDEDPYIMDVFANGTIFLTVNTLDCAEQYLADMTDDFYVVPLPMFNRDQFDENSPSLGYSTQIGDSVSQYAICVDAGEERIPVITATMELLGYYSRELVTPAYYDKALKERYTRNPQDKEMIDLTAAGIYGDFALMWSSNLGNVTWFFRTNYNQHSQMARKLRNEQDEKSYKLKDLLKAIEEAFYVETY